jgi:hypothetical protein
MLRLRFRGSHKMHEDRDPLDTDAFRKASVDKVVDTLK